MAPEHPFPTPTNDCFSVVKYVLENYKELKINPERLIIAGDSAGKLKKKTVQFFISLIKRWKCGSCYNSTNVK